MELTGYERKTLEILQKAGGYMRPSSIGYALFEDEQPGRKKNPSPQGMALAAGRHLGPLERRGLVHKVSKGWAISGKGVEALKTVSASLF